MPYLSKLRLNPRRRGAVSLLSNPHKMHAAVLAGLATQPVTERVLWRLEHGTSHQADVLILTESRPSWEHIIEEAGWPGADDSAPLIADYTPLLERVVRGREFAFRLTANPVHSVLRPTKPSEQQNARIKQRSEKGGKTRGSRVAHRTVTQQLAWLLHRAGRHGFTIPDATITPPLPGLSPTEPTAGGPAVQIISRDILRFRKHRDAPRITLSSVTFQGRLRVTEPNALHTALLGGIGPAKGYGQGLLTLAPLHATGAQHG